MTTLRSRLLLRTGVATAVVLFASGLAIFALVRAALVSEFDAGLLSAARTIQSTTERGEQRIKIEPDTAAMPEYTRRQAPDYFRAWLDDGTVVGQSQSVIGGGLVRPVAAPNDGAFSFVALPDGQQGRQVAIRFVPRPEDEEEPAGMLAPPAVTLVVARHTAPLDAEMLRLRWLLLAVGFAATIACAMTIFVAVSRGLRPLEALARRISRIGQDNLAQQIELRDTPGELTAVVNRLNELLARLDEFVRRERAFTADVAHELRTPLGGLEATLGVCLLRERSISEYRKSAAKSLDIVHDMNALVDNLLMLARADAGQLKLATCRVEVRGLLEECWADFEARAAGRDLVVTFDVESDIWLVTDPEKLSIVLRNLLDNAVSHSDTGGKIAISTRQAADHLEISIVNTASKIAMDQLDRVFDRFWRADGARGSAGGHCGLGLSLCQKITELLGGKISVDAPTQGEFRVRVTFDVPVCGVPRPIPNTGA